MSSRLRHFFLLFFLLLTGGLTLVCGITSTQWIDVTFPGFFVLDNHVVASISLSHWPIAAHPHRYQHEVIAVNGQPVTTTTALYTQIRKLPAGTPVTYTLAQHGQRAEVTLPTARFTVKDWTLLFGTYFVNGIALALIGIVAWYWSPSSSASPALLSLGVSMGLFLITAADLYAPHWFFRLHILTEAAFPAAALHLALVFPFERIRRNRSFFLALPYLVTALLGLGYELFLYRPQVYTLIHNLCTWYAGIAGVFLLGKMVWDYWSTASVELRRKIRVVVLGSLSGYGLPAILMLLTGLKGGQLAVNYAAFTLFVFPLSIGYVLVTQDLLRIERLLRQSTYALTGLVFVVLFLSTDRLEARAALPSIEHRAESTPGKRPTMTAKGDVDRTAPQSDPLLIKTMLLVCRHDFLPGCLQGSKLGKRTRTSTSLADASIPLAKQSRTLAMAFPVMEE